MSPQAGRLSPCRYELLCPRAVAKELGRDNLTSLRLQALLTTKPSNSRYREQKRSNSVTLRQLKQTASKDMPDGGGERATINLALERGLLLLIDDWRPYEAAHAAGVEVANTPAYLLQLYDQGRISIERVLNDFGKLARRGTLKSAWIQAALKMVAEIHKKGEHQ
jgi:predicted nucleic acid-binding protein